jgi:hypothetical protein
MSADPHVVLAGSPITGWTITGPFTLGEAVLYAEEIDNNGDLSWQGDTTVVPLLPGPGLDPARSTE